MPPTVPLLAQIAESQADFSVWSKLPGVYQAIRLRGKRQGDCFLVDVNTVVLSNALDGQFSIQASLGDDASSRTDWNDPERVVTQFGLLPLRDAARNILAQMFGQTARLDLEVISDPSFVSPSLVFRLSVPREMRGKRQEFVRRYARETILPPAAPAPALMWSYQDAIPA